MKDKLISEDMVFQQLEDALEERQNPDRRKRDRDLPEGVMADRRKEDRRSSKKKRGE